MIIKWSNWNFRIWITRHFRSVNVACLYFNSWCLDTWQIHHGQPETSTFTKMHCGVHFGLRKPAVPIFWGRNQQRCYCTWSTHVFSKGRNHTAHETFTLFEICQKHDTGWPPSFHDLPPLAFFLKKATSHVQLLKQLRETLCQRSRGCFKIHIFQFQFQFKFMRCKWMNNTGCLRILRKISQSS